MSERLRPITATPTSRQRRQARRIACRYSIGYAQHVGDPPTKGHLERIVDLVARVLAETPSIDAKVVRAAALATLAARKPLEYSTIWPIVSEAVQAQQEVAMAAAEARRERQREAQLPVGQLTLWSL